MKELYWLGGIVGVGLAIWFGVRGFVIFTAASGSPLDPRCPRCSGPVINWDSGTGKAFCKPCGLDVVPVAGELQQGQPKLAR